MKFKDYINIWEKEHPLALNCDYSREDRFTNCSQRVDWLYYCVENKCKEEIKGEEIDLTLKKIIELFMISFCDKYNGIQSFISCGSIALDYFKVCKNGFDFSKDKLEKMDDQILDCMIDLIKSDWDDISFELLFEKVISWYNFHHVFLHELELGFSPRELYIPLNFYNLYKCKILPLRNTEYDLFIDFANYSIWMYDNAKDIPRIFMVGDLSKFNEFAVLCCRNSLVAAHNNGYFEMIDSIKKMIRSIQSDIYTTPTVFISYNWGKTKLVDEIQNRINKYVIVKRDKYELTFGDSLTEFMNTIRTEDFALLVISDAYLKSEACIYEITTLFKDIDREKFKQKVMFLICEDAQIYNPKGRATYIEFWENKYRELEEQKNKLSTEASVELAESIRKIAFIRLWLGEFLEYVKDVNNFGEKDAIEKIESFISKYSTEGKSGSNILEDFFLAIKDTVDKESK